LPSDGQVGALTGHPGQDMATTVPGPRETIGRGREADIIAWGDGRVLKLYLSPDRCGDAEHEARVTAAVHAAGCPAPACFGVAELDGRTGVVLQRLDGPMLLEILLAASNPSAVLDRLVELQAEVHRHEVPGLPALHARMGRRIERVRPVAGRLANAALEQLARLPEESSLCHWDLHPGNVVVTGRGPVVIDWSGTATGNPLADVARTLFLLGDAPLMDDTPEPVRRRVAEIRAAGVGRYLDRYCEITGVAQDEIAAWRLPVLVDRLVDGIPEERDLLLRLAGAS